MTARDLSKMEEASAVTVYLGEDITIPGLRTKRNRRVVRAPDVLLLLAPALRHLFFICRATLVGEVAPLILKHHKNLRGLLVLQDIDPRFVTPLLYQAKLKNLRNLIVHEQAGLFESVSRILNAWEADAADKLIADAIVAGDQLLVRSCDFALYKIPFNSVKALKKLDAPSRQRFEIAGDGSYIHWKDNDTHLDLESLRYSVDPDLKAKKDQDRLLHDTCFGAAVASVRNLHGLKQASFPGLSEREIRRIEKGVTRPRLSTLEILAEAHGMSLRDYLSSVRLNIRQSRAQVATLN